VAVASSDTSFLVSVSV